LSMLWRAIGNSGEVDDLAQEVFMAALTGVGSFQGQAKFQSWLLSIARHKAIDHLRKRGNQKSVAGQKMDQFVRQRQVAAMLGQGIEPADFQALRRCLDKLSDDHRQLIQQVYFEDRSAADVARSTRQAGNAVRMRLMRIRKALSGCIKKETSKEQLPE